MRKIAIASQVLQLGSFKSLNFQPCGVTHCWTEHQTPRCFHSKLYAAVCITGRPRILNLMHTTKNICAMEFHNFEKNEYCSCCLLDTTLSLLILGQIHLNLIVELVFYETIDYTYMHGVRLIPFRTCRYQ